MQRGKRICKEVKESQYHCMDFLFQVNGNLVSPMHVLANAEVVEIITYNVSIYHL